MNPITERPAWSTRRLSMTEREDSTGSSVDQPLTEGAGNSKSVMGRLLKALMLVIVAIGGGGVFGLYKKRVDVPAAEHS